MCAMIYRYDTMADAMNFNAYMGTLRVHLDIFKNFSKKIKIYLLLSKIYGIIQ